MLRIAHFVQRYPPALGGAEAYFARLSRYFRNQGDQVTVFTTTALALEAFWSNRGHCLPAGVQDEDGVQVRRYPMWRMPGRRYLLKGLSLWPGNTWKCLTMPCNPISFAMLRDSRTLSEPFDIVHASAFPYAWPIVCAVRLARRLRVPFLLTPFVHLGDPHDPNDATRRAYTTPALLSLVHAADAVFVQTPSEGAELRRLGIPAARIVEQGLGVDVVECTGGDRSAARARWQVRPGETVVGHLANNSREKGTIDLLQAAEQLWQANVPVRVILAGPEMPNFTRFWRDFEHRCPPAAVVRLGVLSDQQKKEFFAGLDVFALPSRSDSFGLVLLEAWANGVANVVYRAGGLADVVQHERDGILVRCGDVGELSSAIARLSQSEELRRGLGETGRQRLAVDFRWEDKLDIVRRKVHEIVGRG